MSTNAITCLERSAVAVFDLDWLFRETFEPLKWAVPGLIPEGCILFAGRPKLGKSWFVLQLALAVASGGKAFGEIPVEQSDVLYLALEDTKRRLQSRARSLLGDQPLPSGLKMCVEWPRIDNGGAEELEYWLENHPRTRLVIVDTFQKIKSRRRGSDFETLSRLTKIAQKFGICLLVVHHTRKADAADAFDTISGATETASLADAMLVLKRARCSREAVLHITGRDIDEAKKALRFDKETMSWELLGDADQVWQSRQRAEIIKLLQDEGTSMRPAEIADCLGKSRAAVRKTLSRMVRDNQIERTATGLYDLKEDQKPKDPVTEERDRVRKETNLQIVESIKRIYGDAAEDLAETEYDFPEGLLDQIKLIYGKKPVIHDVEPVTENRNDDKISDSEIDAETESPAEPEEPPQEDPWAKYRDPAQMAFLRGLSKKKDK